MAILKMLDPNGILRAVACAGCLLLGGAQAAAQVTLPEWDRVEIVTHDLGDGLYMLEGFGGNIGVSAGEDGILLVDDQYAPLTGKIRAALAEISDAPVRFVVNTHWHADHTGGNEKLGAAGAVLVAHDNTRLHLIQAMADMDIEAMLRPSPDSLPVLTFDDRLTFHLNGERVQALHIPPAHTDGDVIVIFKEANVIHVGDDYFNGYYPFIDVAHGGSIDGMIAFLGNLVGMSDTETQIIPGHGPVAGRADVERYRADLIEIRRRVHDAIADGRALEELIAARPLEDFDPRYASDVVGQADVLRMVYRSLIRNGDGGDRR